MIKVRINRHRRKILDYDKYPMHGQNVRVANMENYDISAKAVGQEAEEAWDSDSAQMQSLLTWNGFLRTR
ncbi:MAG: hypothetical protein ACLUKN_00150 [Bacilli bacterium]